MGWKTRKQGTLKQVGKKFPTGSEPSKKYEGKPVSIEKVSHSKPKLVIGSRQFRLLEKVEDKGWASGEDMYGEGERWTSDDVQNLVDKGLLVHSTRRKKADWKPSWEYDEDIYKVAPDWREKIGVRKETVSKLSERKSRIMNLLDKDSEIRNLGFSGRTKGLYNYAAHGLEGTRWEKIQKSSITEKDKAPLMAIINNRIMNASDLPGGVYWDGHGAYCEHVGKQFKSSNDAIKYMWANTKPETFDKWRKAMARVDEIVGQRKIIPIKKGKRYNLKVKIEGQDVILEKAVSLPTARDRMKHSYAGGIMIKYEDDKWGFNSINAVKAMGEWRLGGFTSHSPEEFARGRPFKVLKKDDLIIEEVK